jgi:oligopeptide/dipeptide ABC transporter ATP-binding protein
VSASPLLEATAVSKRFPLPRTLSEFFAGRPGRSIHAVDAVSVSIAPGETLGLIGESGSGKTTLGWALARLHPGTEGSIRFEGREIAHLSGEALRRWRSRVQIVFQDPVGSLDPRLRVWEIVGEPIRVQAELVRREARESRRRQLAENRRVGLENARRVRRGEPPVPLRPLLEVPTRLTRGALRARVRALLPTVGLPADCLDQYPHEFSGGGRQRLSLARALSVDPKLVILDEPTSALDVSVQAQILNRLVELQRERGVAYLLITHNVAAVRYVADRVAVLYLGQLLEVGSVREVLERPVHPYTKALLAALPTADPARRRTRFRLSGDVPTLIDPKPGCRFAPRCPFVQPKCRLADPPLRPAPGAIGHLVACVRAEEVGPLPPGALLEEMGRPPPPGNTPAPVS